MGNDQIDKSRPLFFAKQQRMSRPVSQREHTAKIHPDDAKQEPLTKRKGQGANQILVGAYNIRDLNGFIGCTFFQEAGTMVCFITFFIYVY